MYLPCVLFLYVFKRKRAHLSVTKKKILDERMLFHGTDRRNIKSICSYNFDLRLAGRNGGSYGKGIYFAKHASFANLYCPVEIHNGTITLKTMILARVLVAEFTQGDPWMYRVPSKEQTTTEFYDSCVNMVTYPNIFVVFDSSQIYPEYLIEFH
ncbi:protein mono-ADP-ribosyltransferase PARP11-like [Megalops cyprinoides]|uniref:protein mono-ADP-ribosyltransferase PARP11-like n=1 Tax=Megalops cyprinoides TaxID=118141 RepID=UPI0018640061|nr:protein mono-ADP-ribosyltransferase PARP11-like [Megalops cyprinoides]